VVLINGLNNTASVRREKFYRPKGMIAPFEAPLHPIIFLAQAISIM
jgi:hypothetical protein